MLGLTLDTWNNIMLSFLGIAAIAAAFVGVSTYATIQLAKQEAADAKRDFDAYKLTVAGQVARPLSERRHSRRRPVHKIEPLHKSAPLLQGIA
jgi:hypothetical protein